MVGQKAQAELEWDQPGCHRQQMQFLAGQKAAGFIEVALQNGATQIEIEMRLAWIGRRLAGRVAGRAQAVAKVVVHQAGLRRVEVDQRHHPPTGFVEQQVIELGIAVNDTHRQPARAPRRFQGIDDAGARGGEVETEAQLG